MRRLTILVLLAAALPALATAADKKPKKGKAAPVPPPSAKVSVVGYRVVGAPLGAEGDTVRAFNWSEGVTVVIAAQVQPPYGLVALDKDRSTIALTDSSGAALAVPSVDWSPDFTKDHLAALVDLEAKGLPAAGSTGVNVKGSLLFTAATGTKVLKAPAVKLETGIVFKLGTTPITVGEVGEGYGGGPMVEFKGPKSALSTVKALKAKDAKGTPVEASWSSTSSSNDDWTLGFTFKTDKKGGIYTLEFEVWDGMRDFAVPIDVKAGAAVGP